MLINLTSLILGPRGEPVPDGDGSLTLGGVIFAALNAAGSSEDAKQSVAQKLAVYKLLLATTGESADLTAEDVTLIKERIGRFMHPLVVGRAYELLDPPAIKAVA